MGAISVTLPIRTMSEPNQRGHWAKKARRVESQRGPVELVLRAAKLPEIALDVLVCRLTRIAPRELDDDNLRGALKAVRDGVADAFGIDDRDPRVRWEYAQRRGKVREYAITIEIAPAGA